MRIQTDWDVGHVAHAPTVSSNRERPADRGLEISTGRAPPLQILTRDLVLGPLGRSRLLMALPTLREAKESSEGASPAGLGGGPERYVTPGGTPIVSVAKGDYHPKTVPHRVNPRDPRLSRYLQRRDRGAAWNVENMSLHAVWGEIRRWSQRPDSLSFLAWHGIHDLQALSPREAMEVATQVARDIITYDDDLPYGTAKGFALIGAYLKNLNVDQKPLEDFFESGLNGVCRHYAEVVQGVFMVLKRMQTPGTSQLVNSYVKIPLSPRHAWNAIYTVQPDGEVWTTQFDATFTDLDLPGTDTGADYSTEPVREHYRFRSLLEGTGSRSLEQFRRTFVDRDSRFAEITRWSVGRAGGMRLLSSALESLPSPLKPDALRLMSSEVRQRFDRYRRRLGLSTLSEVPPAIPRL